MRSFVLLAAFLALANASSLVLTRQEIQGWNPLSLLWQRSWVQQQSPAQEIRQHIQKYEFVNAQQDRASSYGQDAQQIAQRVLEQARQRQMVQSIPELQKQLKGEGVTNDIDQISTNEAIRNLREWLQYQQLVAPQILVNSQLTHTLQSLIQAESASKSEVDTGLTSRAFQTRVQQLIDISNNKEVEVEILNQQALISELQQQQQWVAEQIQRTQSQQNTVSSQWQDVIQLQEQARRLSVEILVRQLVIQQLQQALVDQQQQVGRISLVAQDLVWTRLRPQTGFWNVPSRTQEGLRWSTSRRDAIESID